MHRYSRLPLLILSLSLVFAATTSSAGIPCIPDDFSWAQSNPGRVLIVPDGSGDRLDDRGCAVTVYVGDCSGQPIGGFPAQDIWLNDGGAGDIWICPSGSIADQATDAAGMATISGTMSGGGHSNGPLLVYLSGVAMYLSPIEIQVVSVDMNADLIVNMVDVAMFAVDFGAVNHPARSDFTHDGLVNLSDVGVLAAHLGVGCP